MGFPRHEYWSGVPFHSPWDLPDGRVELRVSCIAGEFFTAEPPGKPISLVIFAYVCYIYFPHDSSLFCIDWLANACVLSCFSCVRLFVTLWTEPSRLPVHGILQARILGWVAIASSRGSSPPVRGSNQSLLCLLHWQAGSLPLVPSEKPDWLVKA